MENKTEQALMTRQWWKTNKQTNIHTVNRHRKKKTDHEKKNVLNSLVNTDDEEVKRSEGRGKQDNRSKYDKTKVRQTDRQTR